MLPYTKQRKPLQSMILCMLLLLGITTSIIADEAPAVVVPTPLPQWALSEAICLGVSECNLERVRINENNVLYAAKPWTPDGMLAFYPDGSDPVSIPAVSLPYGPGAMWDYEPFGDDYILHFALGIPPAGSSGPNSLYLQDLQTSTTTQLNLPTGFTSCTHWQLPKGRSFYRLGDSQRIIACKLNEIHVIDIPSQTIVETITLPLLDHALLNPAVPIAAGENEQIYLRGVEDFVFDQLLPDFDYQSYPSSLFILHRPIEAADWDVITMPWGEFTAVFDTSTGLRSVNISDFVIDQDGNLYYFVRWASGSDRIQHVDLVKYNPQGERVWHVTEAEIGDDAYLIDILDDGSLLIGQDGTIEAKRIVALNADAGPDQTVTAQNGMSADVTLDGSNSSGENTIVSYSWTDETGLEIATGITPTLDLAVGEHTITLTVTDDDGLTGSDEVVITVNPGGPERVTEGVVALYDFGEGAGTTVHDVSGFGTPLNLIISDPADVEWIPGGLSVEQSTLIASNEAAAKIYTAVTAADAITIEAWIAPANITQNGPARIVSMSLDHYNRDFTLGQVDDTFDVRLRTTTTNFSGVPSLSTSAGAASTALTHVVYTRDGDGAAQIYVNGAPVVSDTVGGHAPGSASDRDIGQW